ncbi:hypothetical protein D3C81_2162420 [compost metagenome]
MAMVLATMKPEATHCALSCPSPKCALKAGMARFMLVEGMIEAIVPASTDSSKSQR